MLDVHSQEYGDYQTNFPNLFPAIPLWKVHFTKISQGFTCRVHQSKQHTLAFSSDIIESFLSKYVFLNAIYLSLLSSTYTFLRKKSSLTIWLTMLYPFKKKLRHFKICLLHLITLGYMILYYFVHIYHL